MLDDVKTWLSHPFQADMSALHWFYFFGLLIMIGGAWGLILRTLRGAA